GSWSSENQRKKLLARLMLLAKDAEHGAGQGLRMLFLNAPHHHAEMARFDYHPDALRADPFLQCRGNVLRQPILSLRYARKHIHQQGNLAETDHLLVGEIRYMAFPEIRQHVMLAEAE